MEKNPSYKKYNDELVVDVKYTKRQVLPAVKLERKNITMTKPPDTVPCIVTVTEDETIETTNGATTTTATATSTTTTTTSTTTITTTVGGSTSPLGEGQERDTPEMGVPQTNGHTEELQETDKPGSRLTVQFAELPPKRTSENVMEFLEEQEKSLKEQFKSLPAKARKTRSPSPSMLRQSVGLDHLDNLVRLMEQLAQLRDENAHLKKKCAYLENTKDLLQAKTTLGEEALPLGYMSLPAKGKPKLRKANTDPDSKEGGHRSRPRLPSAEDATSLDYGESSSDQSPKRPKPGPLKKRSFSTGSLDVSSEILDDPRDQRGRRNGGLPKSKSGKDSTRGIFGSKSPKSKSSKSSKWARVKKVLTGQKLYEDISFRFGKGTHVRYHSVGSPQELSPPSQRGLDGRSLDSGVSSSLDVDGHPRTSSSSAEPPSPSKSPNQTEDRDLDLTTDIWMGPPEWLEQHDSRKVSGASNTSEEIVSTIIELKSAKEGEKFLKVQPLPRRQSSPTLGESQDEEMDASEAGKLHRSSSYKGTESDSTLKDDDASTTKSSERDSKKLHKTPWGRVKDMIHTRKDSLKKKKKGDNLDVSECSEADGDAFEEHLRSDQFGEGVMSRSTPRTSPIAVRQRGSKSCSESPPTLSLGKISPTRPSLPTFTPADMAALLATGVSEEYIKKLQEWEELKTKKPSQKAAIMEEGDMTTSQDSSFLSQDSAVGTDRSKTRGSSPRQTQSRDSSGDESPDDVITSADVSPSVNVDDLQKRITESFSRKLQEWERIKYRRDTKEGSPEIERKGSKSRKDERQKSKKSREEKEKEKMERQRERDLQKVEREQIKLEKEKMRLEKERLRALEREAKLEKMKGRLSQSDDGSYRNPIISPMAEYKVTADFARKLHEWELMKGLSHDISTAIYLEAQKRSLQQSREAQDTATVKSEPQTTSRSEGATGGSPASPPDARPKSTKPPPLTLHPYWDSPEETSPIEKSSEASVGDDTSITDESTTVIKSNIASVDSFDSLERANIQLLEELQRKELEYAAIQEEVHDLNTKLSRVREEHATEIGTGALQLFSRYRKQLSSAVTSEAVKVEVGQLESTVVDLEQKIKQLEGVGEKLAESMETAAVGKWQSIEGEELVSVQLMELVEQMRVMLLQASQSREASQKSSALHNFEKLYSQAMQLQVQMNNLRLSHLQRNKEIMDIKRQLLLQEVNNLLLQADITRRESELFQYQESRHPAAVKRWNTFGGADRGVRVVEGRESDRPSLQRFISMKETEIPPSEPSPPPAEKRETIPFITAVEKRKQEKVGENGERQPADGIVSVSSADLDKQHSKLEKQATDNVEKHLKTTKESEAKPDKKPLERKAAIHDENLEVVTTLSLPTAHVTLPKDISKTELSVPKVEKGSPTLEKDVTKQPVSRISEPAASSQSQQTTVTETPDEPIPERLRGLEKPKLVKSAKIVDDEYSPTETVMPCTELPPSVESYQVESGSVHTSTQDVDITVHGKPAQSEAVTSQEQISARDSPRKDTEANRCSSPKASSPTAAKPPLPPHTQSTPMTSHSPMPRGYLDPEVRSHSAGEISHRSGGDDKQLSDMIKKFEKRATVCETAQHTFELRKTPSPTLYLPQVGLVSPVRRLKPAAELLKESQRYRSGHTAYAARLRQRYLKDEDSFEKERAKSHDKENISASYVQAIVQRLSREGTPTKSVDSSKNNSSLSLQRSDSPRTQSEFVSHIVRKLSSPSGPEHQKFIVPLKDVTNEGQVKKLAEVFDTSPSPKTSPERTLSDSDIKEFRRREKTRVPPSQRRSCELGALYDPSSVITSDSSLKPDSTISPTNHQSMPMLVGTGRQSSLEVAQRDRSATYSTSEHTQSKTGKRPDIDDEEITVVSQETLSSSSSPKASTSLSPTREGPAFPKSSPRSGRKVEFSKLPSPKSHKRSEQGGKKKMGTIGVLCKQSMSFDLGVTLHALEPESPTEGVVFRKSKRSDSSSPPPSQRFSSTSSEGEGAPVSPTDEKKRSRRLLDSRWLHKPKKFFKVSK